jgi:hypothetical protein
METVMSVSGQLTFIILIMFPVCFAVQKPRECRDGGKTKMKKLAGDEKSGGKF